MNKNMLKGITLVLAIALTSSLGGCAKGAPEGPAESVGADTGAPPAASTTAPTEASYPLDTNVTLDYWMELHSNASTYAKSFADLEFAKELEKRTGVKINYIHPAAGQTTETFNILIASNDLPDIIEYNWLTFPGGPGNAINNGVILKLNDTLDTYSPNLKKYLQDNPHIDKQVKTDDGAYFVYPFIRSDKKLQTTSGPMVRKDWLEELGLSVPETIEDWDNMLRQFKDKKGAALPLTVIGDKNGIQLDEIFLSAYRIRITYYIDNGEVKYGPATPEYKEYLAQMNKWYMDGLLDKNFAMTDKKAQDSNILNGKSGATYAPGGGSMGPWIINGQEKEAGFDLSAAKFPVLNKGDMINHAGTTYEFTASNGMAAITAQCKDVETAARYLDYAYGEEGHMFYNFGTENVSYTMEEGYPKYTGLIMDNPDKLSVAQAMTKYSRGNTNGPFIQDVRYIEQYYQLPQQKQALAAWTDQDSQGTLLPPTSFTEQESAEYIKIMADITTYVDEMTTKFIMGTASLTDYDKYLEQLKNMEVDRAIEINQQALDRYNKR